MTVQITTEELLPVVVAMETAGDSATVILASEQHTSAVRILEGGIGAQGPQGIPGVNGRPVTLTFEQGIPSDAWLIPWSLDYRPIVSVYDSTERLVEAEIDYSTPGYVVVLAAYPFAGRAELV